MNVYKLQYDSKEQGFADLLDKGTFGVLNDYKRYMNGTQSIHYIGKNQKKESTEEKPIYYDGVFFDIMTTEDIDFGNNEVFPVKCVHSFSGWFKNADGTYELIKK